MSERPKPLNYLPTMPRNRGVPIGCIGAGFIMDECQLVAYRAAGFQPLAIASRTRRRAAEVAARHAIGTVYDDYRALLADRRIEVVDIAVPPDVQIDVVREAVRHADHARGILAQKPLGVSFKQAREIVELCRDAGITLAVNQNMRYDQSIRACRDLLARGELGTPVLATIEMRAIPHWMPWQERQGWVTLRIMSIHHLDTLWTITAFSRSPSKNCLFRSVQRNMMGGLAVFWDPQLEVIVPNYVNQFATPVFREETIVKGTSKIGTIRVKPSGVSWKPTGDHKFYSVTLDQFTAWITNSATKAKRTSS